MAVKTVIDIPVNDQAFKNFSALFEKYKKAVAEMPEAWKAVDAAIAGAGSTFEAQLTTALATQAAVKGIEEAETQAAEAAERARKREANAARSSAMHWKDMMRTTKSVAGNIASATESLLKWTGVTALFGTVLGGFSWHGLSNMAAGVAGGQRSSRGLGLSYGEQKAFGIDYGPVVDPNSFLSSVNQALRSQTDRVGLIRAGMSPGEMQGSTGQVGSSLLGHLKKIADNTNPAVLGNVIQARGLDQFVTVEDMMRLRSMNSTEFAKLTSRYANDKGSLGLSEETQTKWREFMQQTERAGQQIENVFVKSLVQLEPNLEHLSQSFVKMVESLGDSDTVKHWIDNLADGLEKFATYIGTPEFQTNVKSFVENVGELASGIVSALKWLGLIKDPEKEKRAAEYKESHRATSGAIPLPTGGIANPFMFFDSGKNTGAVSTPGGDDGQIIVKGHKTNISLGAGDKFSGIESRRGLPAGLMNAIYGVESNYGKNAGVSKAGAVGPFQLMPGTAKQYHVQNSNDLGQSSEGAGEYLQHLMQEFKNDIRKAVAAYNWGEGNMHAYERTGKGVNGQEMPRETREYMRKIADALSKSNGQQVTIQISNNSGGNIVTSTAQLAPG